MPAAQMFPRRAVLLTGFTPVLAPVLAIMLTLPLPGRAETAAPKGEIILTLSGLDPAHFPGGEVRFDRAGLAALGPVTFRTTSIWTDGLHSFTGVPVVKLAEAFALKSDSAIILHALNDYEVQMPLAEATPEAPILAYEMDGKPMSVRDKGPIWVVYPYDAKPALYQTVTAFARSVWQLDRIEVSR